MPPWIDLDANATTRPAPEVVDAMAEACREAWANPSSAHRAGQRARAAVELARREVAGLIGAAPREIVFTSCATESIHLALHSMGSRAQRAGGESAEILTSPLEHAAVGEAIRALGLHARPCAVSAEGLIDADDAIARLDGCSGVALHAVNNETGAIQPIAPLIDAARQRGIPVLIDATQAVGRTPVDAGALAADYIAFSAHKFHGPKGAGMLHVRPGALISPLIAGAQELGRRGGTEAVPAICGAGVAARLARDWLAEPSRRDELASLRDALEAAILAKCPGAAVNGPAGRRLWTTTNIALRGLEAEALLLMLSERGVGASAGAACSSGSLEPSPVLLAMGLDEPRVRGSIRLSLSRESSEEEVDRAASIIAECAGVLRRMG